MALAKLNVDFWLHSGRLGKSELSLCLYHKSAELGRPLLERLKQLELKPRPSECSFSFVRCDRQRALSKLLIQLVPQDDALRVMNLQCADDKATIRLTDLGLPLLIEAFAQWLAGMEDFGVSPRNSRLGRKQLGQLDRESIELWFWGPYYYAP